MRGKLTDQDLTNYSLNDGLAPRERLYVESMLGADEASRGDVYKMLDLAQLLERGFEAESDRTIPMLTRAQRSRLLAGPPRPVILPFVRKAAGALSLAACVAFVFMRPGAWNPPSPTEAMAEVSTGVTRIVADAIAAEPEEDDYTMFVSPMPLSEDDSSYIQTSVDMPPAAEEAICTPPADSSVVPM